jgi:hypothetical protein
MNPKLKTFLDTEGCYFRENPALVDQALERMGASPPSFFVDFYKTYEGGFCSKFTAFELSDVVGHMEEMTSTCRTVHSFPEQCLVIADEVADAVLVYDWVKDAVYCVDFEGSDELLKKGELEPDWNSFEEFLAAYFLGMNHGTEG